MDDIFLEKSPSQRVLLPSPPIISRDVLLSPKGVMSPNRSYASCVTPKKANFSYVRDFGSYQTRINSSSTFKSTRREARRGAISSSHVVQDHFGSKPDFVGHQSYPIDYRDNIKPNFSDQKVLIPHVTSSRVRGSKILCNPFEPVSPSSSMTNLCIDSKEKSQTTAKPEDKYIDSHYFRTELTKTLEIPKTMRVESVFPSMSEIEHLMFDSKECNFETEITKYCSDTTKTKKTKKSKKQK